MHSHHLVSSLLRPVAWIGAALLAAVGPARAETTAENTAAVVAAANAFLATLTTAQKTAIDSTADVAGGNNSSVLYNFTLTNAEIWSNLPTTMVTRNGLRFAELSTTQLAAALAIANVAVSSSGATIMEEIRLADQYIGGEVTNSKGTTSSMWGYKKYYIAFVGTPSTTSTWTLQIGGHHLAYNITYNGTYLSCTPMFAASEPVSWTYNGVTHYPLGTMRNLILSLRPTLTTSALLSGTYSDVVFGPNGTGSHDTVQPKSYPTSGRGQLYSSLNSTQQGYVRSYITAWVNHHAGPRADEFLALYLSSQALAETYVGYAGSSTTMGSTGSYFRIDGPRVWIEYIVQGGVWDASGVHDHALFRDKLSDYGASYGSTTISTTLRPPTITTPPASQTVTAGSGATFSVVAASAGTGAATLSYQWYKGTSAISSATSASYTIGTVTSDDAGFYSVRVISTGGLVTSSAATLTVNTIAAPTITTPPASVAANVGDNVSFTVVASGGGTLTYQWYKGTAAIDGATSATYAIASAPASAAGSYHVVVTNSAGSATSDDATLTLTAAPSITTPPASVAANVGDDVSFTVVASGDGTLTYQWFKSTAAIDGATSATYSISAAPASAAGAYHVVVTNSAGSATSDDATLTLTEPYAAYLSAHGLAAGSDSEDPDGDGVANLLEFVFGGDPTTPETDLQPVATYDSSALLLSFTVNTSLGSVTYSVESSPDLATWTTATPGESGVLRTVTAAGSGRALVIYSLPSATERLFARVRVTAP